MKARLGEAGYPRSPASPMSCSWAWVSPSPTSPLWCPPCAPSALPGATASPPARSPSPPSASPRAIEKLAEQLDLPVTLALSLHAPNDELRRTLIPWSEFTTINELLASCQKWFEKTGREITLEYTLLRGVNDQPIHARQLADLSQNLRGNVNLIRYNEVAGMPFERPRDEDVLAFQDFLRSKGVNVHIRASRGRDIAAACGQLRHETGNKQRKTASV